MPCLPLRTALAFALLAPAAMAQDPAPHEFFPLAEGDRWEYVVTYNDVLNGYIVVEGTGDPADGREGAAYTVTWLDADGNIRDELACVGRVSVREESDRWHAMWIATLEMDSTQSVEYKCGLFSHYWPGDEFTPIPSEHPDVSPVRVGDETVPTSGIAITAGGYQESGGQYTEWHTYRSAGLGLYHYRERYTRSRFNETFITVAQLAYARVGGQEYGARVVAGETRPSAVHLLRIGPNPTRGPVYISMMAPGSVRASAYDLLGRRVAEASGPAGTVTIDLGPFPAGVYVVEVRDEGGRPETALVTRVE